jgi:hypothetical protein
MITLTDNSWKAPDAASIWLEESCGIFIDDYLENNVEYIVTRKREWSPGPQQITIR